MIDQRWRRYKQFVKKHFSKIKGDSIIVHLTGACLPWYRVRELTKDSYVVDTGTYFKNTHLSKICCFSYEKSILITFEEGIVVIKLAFGQ